MYRGGEAPSKQKSGIASAARPMGDSDLYHRKVFGHLGRGVYSGWKVAGQVFRVGASSALWIFFEWDEQWQREHPDIDRSPHAHPASRP